MPTPTEEITIRVDPKAARAYRSASEQDRRRFDLLLSLELMDLTNRVDDKSLHDLMDRISRQAKGQGMTPEILESILSDKETER